MVVLVLICYSYKRYANLVSVRVKLAKTRYCFFWLDLVMLGDV